MQQGRAQFRLGHIAKQELAVLEECLAHCDIADGDWLAQQPQSTAEDVLNLSKVRCQVRNV